MEKHISTGVERFLVENSKLAKHFDDLEAHGFCVVEDVLTAVEVSGIREKLLTAATESNRRGVPTHIPSLDPNDANVRVFNLLDLDPIFLELMERPEAIEFVKKLVGDDFIVSNFTANIARPGAKSMHAHSDLGIVFPGPWLKPWSMNVLWCLDDVHQDNGATRYLPNSHKITYAKDVPHDMLDNMRSFNAKAGSIIIMDGRLWHTSGENVTEKEERAIVFGYYSAAFLRPQVNWNVLLAESTQRNLSSHTRRWLGLNGTANMLSADFVDGPDQPSTKG
jgi:ectoine hydroxylase-related dioxygenase (phytanoyl-CoA dioxygenase family)